MAFLANFISQFSIHLTDLLLKAPDLRISEVNWTNRFSRWSGWRGGTFFSVADARPARQIVENFIFVFFSLLSSLMRIEPDTLAYEELRMSENSATMRRGNWPTSITVLQYSEGAIWSRHLMNKSKCGKNWSSHTVWRMYIDYTVWLRFQIQSVVTKT